MKVFTKNEIREILYEKLWTDEKWGEMRELCFDSKDVPSELVEDFIQHLINEFGLSINDVYYNACE